MAKLLVGAVLAAGSASRFGGLKQLALFRGKALIDIALDSLFDAHVDRVCVVIGSDAETIQKHLDSRTEKAAVVQNHEWKRGMSTSIHRATEYAMKIRATHLLLVPCDQPYLNASVIQKFLQATATDNFSTTQTPGEHIIASRYGDAIGIPAIFSANCFPELLNLTGDKGAKGLILANAISGFIDFPMGTVDIDTKEELQKITSH